MYLKGFIYIFMKNFVCTCSNNNFNKSSLVRKRGYPFQGSKNIEAVGGRKSKGEDEEVI